MIPYQDFAWPEPPRHRPYTYLNMVTTLDGKILTGERDETVEDLGSATDHATMRALEREADGVLIGAGLLRATPGLWYPAETARFVATRDPHLDTTGKFFTENAWIVSGDGYRHESWPHVLTGPDWAALLGQIRQLGIERLLIEGGSELNAQLLKAGLVDEIFMTLAPKLKLGRDVPTLADGEPFSRAEVQTWTLVELHRVESELFLRYRRNDRAEK